MPDYIDRDALLAQLNLQTKNDYNANINKIVMSMPSASVEPIRQVGIERITGIKYSNGRVVEVVVTGDINSTGDITSACFSRERDLRGDETNKIIRVLKRLLNAAEKIKNYRRKGEKQCLKQNANPSSSV